MFHEENLHKFRTFVCNIQMSHVEDFQNSRCEIQMFREEDFQNLLKFRFREENLGIGNFVCKIQMFRVEIPQHVGKFVCKIQMFHEQDFKKLGICM